jgi:hypothetical protein
MSRNLPGMTAPPPSSALICPPLAYMTTVTCSLLIVSCLAFACAVAVVAAAAAAVVKVAAAGVIDARSLIKTIEREGSKPSFDILGQFNSTVQADGLFCVCQGSPGGGSRGDTCLGPPPKLTKRQHIDQPQQQGTKKWVAGGGGNG